MPRATRRRRLATAAILAALLAVATLVGFIVSGDSTHDSAPASSPRERTSNEPFPAAEPSVPRPASPAMVAAPFVESLEPRALLRVVDEHDEPVSAVRVSASPRRGRSVPRRECRDAGATDDAGDLELRQEILDFADAMILEKDGFATQSVTGAIASGETRIVRMEQGYDLSGCVRLSGGSGVAGIRVDASRRVLPALRESAGDDAPRDELIGALSKDGERIGRIEVDESGRARTWVPLGTIELRPEIFGISNAPQTFDINVATTEIVVPVR